MAAEAIFKEVGSQFSVVATGAVASGEIYQSPAGFPGVHTGLNAAATNDTAGFTITGKHTVLKTASIAILAGLPVYWDHSANKAHYMRVNDRDFYLGVCASDAAATDTTVDVYVNAQPRWDIDCLAGGGSGGGVLSVPTGTQAVGAFGFPKALGGSQSIELTATNEAQCIDFLSVDKCAVGAKGIAQFIIRYAANGSTSAVDFNMGIANGTSTTDADAITEHGLFHIDGGATTILIQTKDGTTTNAAADSTKTLSAGTAVANRLEGWVDFRVTTSVKFYINGVRVLSGTTFDMSAGTGPWGLLVHVEKTSSTATAGPIHIDAARCHFSQQSS